MTQETNLFDMLNNLHITHETIEHEPLFTVEQAKKVRSKIPGGHAKNLFLKDSKKQLWLFITHADTVVPLKKIAKMLKAPELRFANPELLKQYLGVIPGAVTPLGLINDRDHKIRVVFDKKLLSYDRIGFHPLRNDATTIIALDDLKTFIRTCGNQLMFFDFDLLSL